MSYILDALRKADAERERDPARGIHAQPGAGLPAPRHRSAAPWAWGAAALALAGAAAGYVYWPRPAVVPPAPPAGFVKIAPPAPAVVHVATELVPAAPPPLPAPPARAPAKPVAAATAMKAPPAALAPVAAVAAASATASAAAVGTAATAAGTALPSAATAPAAAPGTADRILTVADLPASVQGELPKLAISGGVHSENAAQRLLIVGGQLKTEGAELAPGLVLEQIRPRTAVLRFKGYRYSLPY